MGILDKISKFMRFLADVVDLWKEHYSAPDEEIENGPVAESEPNYSYPDDAKRATIS